MAGWDRAPPVSVTRALKLGKTIDQAGEVMGHTSTSPACILPKPDSLMITRTGVVVSAGGSGDTTKSVISNVCPTIGILVILVYQYNKRDQYPNRGLHHIHR